eukprot:Lithocolla_globosa_v1_NODE_2013_length_2207_cov_49.517658.p1 type:complete len:294 gc:universal NODE_2013_length_2207_cov_49.517658:667-1548(+)
MLARMLPFLLSDLMGHDDPVMKCFSCHLMVLSCAMSPEVPPGLPCHLALLIGEFIRLFLALYSSVAYIPKLHYYLHLPSTLSRYGPLRNVWCMRLEAKHVQIKVWVSNFINLPYSISESYCDKFCLDFLQTPGCAPQKVCDSEAKYGPSELIPNDSHMMNLFSDLTGLDLTDHHLYTLNWAEVFGTKLKPGASVIRKDPADGQLVEYGMLHSLFFYRGRLYFHIDILDNVGFDSDVVAWQVCRSQNSRIEQISHQHSFLAAVSLWRKYHDDSCLYVSDRMSCYGDYDALNIYD